MIEKVFIWNFYNSSSKEWRPKRRIKQTRTNWRLYLPVLKSLSKFEKWKFIFPHSILSTCLPRLYAKVVCFVSLSEKSTRYCFWELCIKNQNATKNIAVVKDTKTLDDLFSFSFFHFFPPNSKNVDCATSIYVHVLIPYNVIFRIGTYNVYVWMYFISPDSFYLPHAFTSIRKLFSSFCNFFQVNRRRCYWVFQRRNRYFTRITGLSLML